MDILILICALTVSAPDCQKKTAIHEMHTEIATPDLVNCQRHGILYAAESGLVTAGTYPKIVCAFGPRPKNVG